MSQSFYGSLVSVVKDDQGGVIPGATIVLVNTGILTVGCPRICKSRSCLSEADERGERAIWMFLIIRADLSAIYVELAGAALDNRFATVAESSARTFVGHSFQSCGAISPARHARFQ
jgi:hypothetical protein